MSKIFEFKDSLQTKTEGRGTTYRLINESMGAQRIGVMLIDLEPEVMTKGVHYHRNREAAYIVLQGSATLMLNGAEHHLKANMVVFLSPGDMHGITSTGKDGFKMIEVYSPLDPDRVDVQD
jgi:mannose-6-phosphate isomerase-like protein (cupin superfamily)